mmetsp:Transcript_16348/g.29735  ORF Transcript_16348/g.29735 Transcript_16348/m.29735 type:complete len:231 (+) Transcript_16348:879-1571(+)
MRRYDAKPKTKAGMAEAATSSLQCKWYMVGSSYQIIVAASISPKAHNTLVQQKHKTRRFAGLTSAMRAVSDGCPIPMHRPTQKRKLTRLRYDQLNALRILNKKIPRKDETMGILLPYASPKPPPKKLPTNTPQKTTVTKELLCRGVSLKSVSTASLAAEITNNSAASANQIAPPVKNTCICALPKPISLMMWGSDGNSFAGGASSTACWTSRPPSWDTERNNLARRFILG